MMKIGFIGLGQMGAPMAANLVTAGFEVTGFDVVIAASGGLRQASSAKDAAQGMNCVITMLPDGNALQQVANAIIPHMTKGALLIDCSTVDVAATRATGDQAIAAGLGYIDAPVSGGITGAINATLTFMIGGKDEDVSRAMTLFETMGKKAVHCGDIGSGQSAKICNNMILGATMIATCEAFDLADRLGLDRGKMFDVVSTSSGYSWSMNAYCPAPGIGPDSPADHDYRPGFSAELMLKDLSLAMAAAENAGANPKIGKTAKMIYDTFVQENGKGKDFSAILPWLKSSG
jgi:3-hydroxyisobutyrate dehydrogenase